MAETGSRNDPIPGFLFTLRFDDLAVAGFSECRGLEIEFEMKEHIEGGLNDQVHHLPTRAKAGKLSLKRGIVDRLVWDWCWDTVQGRIVRRSGAVEVRAPGRTEPALVFEFRRALPSRWSGPELDAGASQVALESLDLAVPVLQRTT